MSNCDQWFFPIVFVIYNILLLIVHIIWHFSVVVSRKYDIMCHIFCQYFHYVKKFIFTNYVSWTYFRNGDIYTLIYIYIYIYILKWCFMSFNLNNVLKSSDIQEYKYILFCNSFSPYDCIFKCCSLCIIYIIKI